MSDEKRLKCKKLIATQFVTDAERQQLVADLEELVLRFGDGTKPDNFDPHAVEAAANRLIKYYTRLNSSPPPVGMSPH